MKDKETAVSQLALFFSNKAGSRISFDPFEKPIRAKPVSGKLLQTHGKPAADRQFTRRAPGVHSPRTDGKVTAKLRKALQTFAKSRAPLKRPFHAAEHPLTSSAHDSTR